MECVSLNLRRALWLPLTDNCAEAIRRGPAIRRHNASNESGACRTDNVVQESGRQNVVPLPFSNNCSQFAKISNTESNHLYFIRIREIFHAPLQGTGHFEMTKGFWL